MNKTDSANAARQAGVTLWPQATCLLAALCDALTEEPSRHLGNILVLLPTQRLRVMLLSALARHYSAYFPPRILTLDQLAEDVYQYTDQAKADICKIADDAALRLLMRETIRDFGARHIHEQHTHESLQLYRELTQHRFDLDKFAEQARSIVRSDIYKSEVHVDTLAERFTELGQLFINFAKRLYEQRLTLRETIVAAGAELLARDSDIHLNRYDWIYCVGQTSIAPHLEGALQAISRHPSASIWLSEPSAKQIEQQAPLAKLVAGLKQDTHKAISNSEVTAHKPIAISLHNHVQEVDMAVRVAKQALERDQIPASKIAILVPSESTYASLLRAAISLADLPANVALTTPLAQSAFGLWLAAIKHCWDEQLSTTSLVRLSTLDLCKHLLKQSLPRVLPPQKIDDLPYRLAKTDIFSNPSALEQHKALQDHTEILQALWTQLSNLFDTQTLRPHRQAIDASAWQSWLMEALQACAELNLDTIGQRAAITNGLTSFFAAGSTVHGAKWRLSPAEFMQLIDSEIMQLPVRDVGEPLQGVQVISLAEARYAPFALTITLGCNEGIFPQSLPRDDLVDDYLKRRLGLPGWQTLEAIESTTFQLLAARSPQLLLLYSQQSHDGPLVRSRFIDALQRQDQLEERAPIAATKSLRSAQPLSDLLPQGAFPGDRQALLGALSASTFESLLRCPYRYLLSRLDVKDVEMPTPPDDPRALGQLLHLILEVFFTGKSRGRSIFAPLPIDDLTRDNFLSKGLDRLQAIAAKLAPAEFLDSLNYRHLCNFAWPRFLQHLSAVYANTDLQKIQSGMREFNLRDAAGQKPTIALAGTPTQISGVIDSIDFISEATLLSDYKNSEPNAQELNLGLLPQLGFYAHALQQLPTQLDTNKIVGGFWLMQKAIWKPFAVGDDVRAACIDIGLASKKTPSWSERWQQIAERLGERRSELIELGQDFAADSSFCGFCNFHGVCRRDDPAYANAVQQQRRIKNSLSKNMEIAPTSAEASE